MELPSMVQRSGDKLIVRSVVSGNQLYEDQANPASGAPAGVMNVTKTPLQQKFESFCVEAVVRQHYLHQQQLQMQQQQQQNPQQQQHQQPPPPPLQPSPQQALQQLGLTQQQQEEHELELKEEGLPQCKIKRNYSCSYCTYFTQNPRCHLTHLRDVHGEKIVINKCQLCLYASRHYQKLVRHMKMVHGCTGDIGHGARGKRGMNREARKRKLEQRVVDVPDAPAANALSREMPTLEELKRELAFHDQKLQREYHQPFSGNTPPVDIQRSRTPMHQNAEVLLAAYEQQLQTARKMEEELQVQARYANAQNANLANAAATEMDQQRLESPAKNNNNTVGFQVPAHQQQSSTARNYDLTPSPTGSTSPSGACSTPTAALSISFNGEELPQNRLLKCSVCDFTTLYRQQLLDHEEEDHNQTEFFRCEKCSYVTHIKARYSKHVKYHSMPMIKCVTCDFRTPYKWNLDRHMKNHGGTGPFKCSACDFTADIKQSLTVHEMNHHVPPVGHAAGMSLTRRRNKVGGTDLCDDFLSDSTELMEDHYNNNNMDDFDEPMDGESYGKKSRYDEDEPTDLSQKGGGSSDTSSVHNQCVDVIKPKPKRPIPNLIPIPKGNSVLNLSKSLDAAGSSSTLTDIASMFFTDKQISEMVQPLEKANTAQLSPSTTNTSTTSSHHSRSLLKRNPPSGSFFDKLKSSALASNGPNENLICPCGYVAKCLSEAIIHRKSCSSAPVTGEEELDDDPDDTDGGRLEIDFAEDEDKQSHSALNLSVPGSTRCQHCRHRCKSSADLINHLKQCTEAARYGNESFDSMSGESSAGREQRQTLESRVSIFNKMGRSSASPMKRSFSRGPPSAHAGSGYAGNSSAEENSYYGVETAPGYGEVTKKMTPEEEAANSSLKKVYKCPHCSFWASTASRFHVHIVGHLNKKPFECSLCSYRSNWRWDITKHIRLKTIRDPSHKSARVLMNDETGRRNYTKYNKYITLMKVTEEDGDPKLLKSGEMTPNQVASLSFFNDYNKNSPTMAQINGLKEDITLEPLNPRGQSAASTPSENQFSDGLIRLPLIASMMNAAMAQQQQQQKQKEQNQQHATLITPSVTISAVKRTTPPITKPSDDVIADIKQEGNEKKTFFRCRKCNFRHENRDAVLAHVKIHYQDPNYPIVTATPTSSGPKSSNQHSTPLHVAVDQNLYTNNLNKMLAMYISQQQQQIQQNSQSSSQDQPAQSMLPVGLLEQAIQGATPSDLALVLAGKHPANSIASILEHGEQKACPDEASAQQQTSPNIALSSIGVASGNGGSGGGQAIPATPSLQSLLTSPRGTFITSGAGSIATNCNKHNNNLVTGLTKTGHKADSPAPAPTGSQHQHLPPHTANPTTANITSSSPAIVTIPTTNLTSTPSTSNATSNLKRMQQQLSSLAPHGQTGDKGYIGIGAGSGGDSVCIGGVYGLNNSNNNSTLTTTTSNLSTTSPTTSFSSFVNSAPVSKATTTTARNATSPSLPSNYNNQSNSNYISNDCDRRDPSPYRCGHCHQLSNWKHVIQRHCRLKHNHDIRIETLDRSSLNERNAAAPVYRPLGNGASNEMNYGITYKALQQQQQAYGSGNLNNNNNNSSNTNNNNVLNHKNELHSSSGNAASTSDLHAAAAAFLAATYKAATTNASKNNNNASNMSSQSNEDLLLQQQLQHNDQIEITRLPPSNNASTSNLAQLLESAQHNPQQPHASKSKQQKCPSCPYISESKSQMNYHISLHKPTQYECQLCTFVCAKKQHLSSHMRNVHSQATSNSTGSLGMVGHNNYDFNTMPIQFKSSNRTQQETSLKPTSMAFDLSPFKAGRTTQKPTNLSNNAQQQELPPEYQYKMIFHCPKCPARFAQKHNEAHYGKFELEEHLKAHIPDQETDNGDQHSASRYKCEFCDFHAPHETLIQTHRYVHTQTYQENCNENFKNCKEDNIFAAPKLMQITLTKNLQTPETVWIVDNDLSEQLKLEQQQQHAKISSSTNSANFDNANSLLKKQLEAGSAPMLNANNPARNTPSPKTQEHDDSSNTTPSTSASVATSDLAGSDSLSIAHSPAAPEKCKHCPFETTDATSYKAHIKRHICVSQQKRDFTCEHCDYTDNDKDHIEEHTRLHFNALDKLKTVAFFTSYDHLELNVEQDNDTNTVQGNESEIVIKQEAHHNNNNEENAVNENMLKEQQQKQMNKESNTPELNQRRSRSPDSPKKTATRIVFTKNEGRVSIKQTKTPDKDGNNSDNSVNSEGSTIGDRLRRRTSRHSHATANGTHEEEQEQKSVLVNVKTGQVLSRNL